MTHPPDTDGTGSPDLAETFRQITASEGHVPNLHRMLAHTPDGLPAFAQLERYCRYGTELTPRQRAVAILVAVRDVHYCWAHHAPLARLAGLTDEQLLLIREGRTPRDLDENERALCEYAHEITACRRIPPRVHEAMLAGFQVRQIIDAALLTSFYMSVAALALGLDIELEPPETLQQELAWQQTTDGEPDAV